MNRIHALMIALEVMFARTANGFSTLFADAAIASAQKMEDLQNSLISIKDQMVNIQAKADAENRILSKDEAALMEELFEQFDQTEKEIDRREHLAHIGERMSGTRGRQAGPSGAGTDDSGGVDGGASRSRATAGRGDNGNGGNAHRPATARPAFTNDVGKWGFRSFGDFAQAVRNAGIPGGRQLDPRLTANTAPTTSTEGAGPDGGFAIPPDFRTEIMEKVYGDASLIQRTDQLTSSSNSISIPKDETTPWQTTGGIQAAWEGEAQQIQASKAALEQSVIRLNSLKALVNVTSELLEDAPALSTYIRRKAPMKIDFKITDGIVNGTGVGMPLGLLNAPCKIKVDKEGTQAAGSIVFANIAKMYARVFSQCRSNLIWLINQDIEPSLFGLQFPGTGTAVPVYLPPGGLSASPYGMLMGKPVIPTEACQTVGVEGDIIAVDLSSYMTATKVGGIRQDVSIHLYFDFDLMAFRFIMRVAGQPWWTSPVTPAKGSNTRSCIVTLADR